MSYTYKIIILLASVIIVNTSVDECDKLNSEKCACFHNNDVELQCPPINFNLLIHAVPNEYLNMECLDLSTFESNLLPDFKLGNVKNVQLDYCPLPDDPFESIMNKFDIHHFSGLKLDNVTVPDYNSSITKDFFKKIPFIKELYMNKITDKLEDDLLDYLSDLSILEIEHSDIDDISSFKFPETLRVLRMTGNLFTNIPEGVFSHLNRLIRLHLWGNKIIEVNKGAFKGLVNLQSLELSSNNINSIDEDSFSDLINLKQINLRGNKLTNLPGNLFRNNLKLESIRLENNPGLIIPDYIFLNLINLKTINLSNNRIKVVPDNIFKGAINLEIIRMQNNEITSLTDAIFYELNRLKTLNLSNNKLNNLPDKIFNLSSLISLDLSKNNISMITDYLFDKTSNLEQLFMQNNKISIISSKSFNKLGKLKTIDLSYNELDSSNLKHLFNSCLNLNNICTSIQRINLKNNLIKDFPDLITLVNLKSIDLSYNQITELQISDVIQQSNIESVNLNNNYLKHVMNFDVAHAIIKSNDLRDNPIKLYLYNNPLACDCANYDLVRYFQNRIDSDLKKSIRIESNSKCNEPDVYRNVSIDRLKPEEVRCEKNISECPKECTSFWKPYNDFYVFNCSNRNLTSFPRIPDRVNKNVELDLSGNVIRRGLNSSLGYGKVKRLFLSNNKLEELKWIPLGIEVLTLDRNELTYLDSELLKIMNNTSLKFLKLSNNPWSCNCSAQQLQTFLQENYQKFHIIPSEVTCRDDKKPLMDKRDICSKSSSTLLLTGGVLMMSFLILTVIALVLYIYYRQEVKVWLYSKSMCLWFVSEEELDEDKTYDIFISYSHKDEDFVIQNLLPVLESGPEAFKTCIHIRDWLPGEMILTNMNTSIANSKRTLVVLSNNFLDSVWGILEFKTAHVRALKEGRMRLVVVKYGDLDESRLDGDLKAYLSTNTYIEWGKPWFWNKLRYALPHSKKNGFYKSNQIQKHANVMLKIDDKFELAVKQPENTSANPPSVDTLKKEGFEVPLVM